MPAREPLLIVAGERSRTRTSGGFIVYGGLLIGESQVAGFEATTASGGREVSYGGIIAAAANHQAHIVANIILSEISAPNSHAHESGMIYVSSRAKTIAKQWRRPLQTSHQAMLLAPVASRLVATLARGLGALEEGRTDPDLVAVLGLFPRTLTGQRNRAALRSSRGGRLGRGA